MTSSGDLHESIDAFFRYFEAQHRFLAELPNLLPAKQVYDKYGYYLVTNMRLLVACTHLETLGRVATGNKGGSRTIFEAVLIKWSGMAEWGLVSLPEMWRRVRNPASIDKDDFRKKLQELAAHWKTPLSEPLKRLVAPREVVERARVVSGCELDTTIPGTIQNLANAAAPALSCCQKVLPHFTYAAILYRDYRCALAHEARRKADGWQLQKSDVPYYGSVICIAGHQGRKGIERIEPYLVIPDAFVLLALENCVERLRAHCEREGIDPYQAGDFG